MTPAVAEDVTAAAVWYEGQREGLGVEFVLELDVALEQLALRPASNAPVWEDVRRHLTRRFPYAIYYLILSDAVEVIAVLHQARAAGAWRSRLE
jgi:plasmid stabilization system protein ParE